jgi:hypothetical protein
MDEDSFDELQRNLAETGTRFDSTRTHRELNTAGIVAPILNDTLLKRYVRWLLSKDPEVRKWSTEDLIDTTSQIFT